MAESLISHLRPYYIYEFKRGDFVLTGTAKELVEQVGGNYRSFICVLHRQGYQNKPYHYHGFRVKRTHRVIPTTVYAVTQEGSEHVFYGSAKELHTKFGLAMGTVYKHASDNTPVHRRGKTFYIKAHGVKEIWKPLK